MASSSSSSTSLLSSFSHLVTTKLNTDNYMLWKVQITAYLKGQELYSFVDGSLPPPPKMLETENNPAYQSWHRTDQLLLSILFASLTDGILGHVISSTTSRELWASLESMFGSQSQAKEFQVRFQLTNLSKGDKTITEYFSKAKQLSDTLAATGAPLSDKEYTTYLLNGLSPSYESFVTSITTRSDPITAAELFHLLLIHESRMAHTTRTLPSPFEPSANLTNFTYSKPQRGQNSARGGRNRGRGRSSSSNGRNNSNNRYTQPNNPNRPVCQVCAKPGHVALQCYHRFNHAYQFEPPASFTANFTSNTSNSDPTWYPDSASTHHLTHDFSQLNLSSEPYSGLEQIRVGNGAGLPIYHSGDSSLNLRSSSFLLKNLLHVPSITKNLVSVSQFCADNSCFFEFHDHFFIVKDNRTKNPSSADHFLMASTASRPPRLRCLPPLISASKLLFIVGTAAWVILLHLWFLGLGVPTICHFLPLKLLMCALIVHLLKSTNRFLLLVTVGPLNLFS